MFKLLNGLYYSEHQLSLNHDKILKEVLTAKVKDDVMPKDEYGVYLDGDWDNYNLYPKNHTFSEDSNLYPHTIKAVVGAISNELSEIFGGDDYWKIDERECWGHIIEPGQQTTIHNHCPGFNTPSGLSFAYYANHPKDSGNIIFQTQINNSNYQADIKPRKGLAVIFNSELWHHTPSNCSKYTRVSISGNFDPTPKLLEILEEDDYCENPYWKYYGKTNV